MSEEAAANRFRAFELRRKGWTYQKIADELGVSIKTAHEYVNAYWKNLDQLTKETAEQVRERELQNLSELERRWLSIALAEELDVSKEIEGRNGPVHIEMETYKAGAKAAEILLKVQERRSKLLGLDAPEKQEVVTEFRSLREVVADVAAVDPLLVGIASGEAAGGEAL